MHKIVDLSTCFGNLWRMTLDQYPKKTTSSPDIQDLKSVITFRLARLQNNLNTQASAILKAHSALSLTEWRIISTFEMLGETTLTDIANWSQVDKGQLSRTIKNLIQRGYLNSLPSKSDGRQQILSLSDKGHAQYLVLLPVMRKRQQNLIAGISAEDLAAFNHVIDQLNANIQTMKDNPETEANYEQV